MPQTVRLEPMQLSIINPLNYPNWDDLVLSTDKCSIFHSSHWARVLSESYGYQPLYFVKIADGKLNMLFPFVEINSLLTGKRGVSLPFTDYCEPIIPQQNNFQDAMCYLIEYAKKAGWKYIEIRANGSLFNGTPPSSFYYGHTLDLSQGIERIFPNLRDSTRRNIRKAEREGIKVTIGNSLEYVSQFYRLNCLTRKMHGLPPQPFSFFKSIHAHLISCNHGIIVLASHKGTSVSGAVYFHFEEKAFYKYGASDRGYQSLRPNNLVMWEAIKWYTLNGYKSLCFGRTEPENKGLMQYKSGWRANEHLIHYYKYDLLKEAFVPDSSKVTDFYHKLFAHMPNLISKMSGTLLYKHMG
jgi:hypothetical protein